MDTLQPRDRALESPPALLCPRAWGGTWRALGGMRGMCAQSSGERDLAAYGRENLTISGVLGKKSGDVC